MCFTKDMQTVGKYFNSKKGKKCCWANIITLKKNVVDNRIRFLFGIVNFNWINLRLFLTFFITTSSLCMQGCWQQLLCSLWCRNSIKSASFWLKFIVSFSAKLDLSVRDACISIRWNFAERVAPWHVKLVSYAVIHFYLQSYFTEQL